MQKMRVLIADDDRDIRRALQCRLTEWGYDVAEFCDGLSVLSQASPGEFGAIILDHEMPLGDGRDLARVLRGETDAPIIFLSGHDSADFREMIETFPDMYYLTKPLDEARLRRLLEGVCSGQHANCLL